jgi:hypothetical protein
VEAGAPQPAAAAAAPRYVLDRQYLHKSLVLILADEPSMTVGVVLNRPSASSVRFATAAAGKGKGSSQQKPGPLCRLGLGGEASLGNANVLVFHRGQVPALLAAAANPAACKPVDGGSGLWVISPAAAGDALAAGLARPSDLLCVAGVTAWAAGECRAELAAGALEPVDPKQVPWEDLFGLYALPPAAQPGNALAASVDVWRRSSSAQAAAKGSSGRSGEGAELEGNTERTRLADAALARYNELFLLPKDAK